MARRHIQDQSDHDILITLVERVDGIKSDLLAIKDKELKEIKDGATGTLTNHENRIRGLEDEVAQARTVLRTMRWLIGILWATVSFIAANLVGIFDFVRR